MKLQFGDKIINVRTEEKGNIVSMSTGNQLAAYTIYFDVKGNEVLDRWIELVGRYKEENLNELDNDNNILRKFRVSNSSYNYNGASNDESTIYHYLIDVIEYEELFTSVITIAGIDCNVLVYNEEIDKDTNAIIISAIIKQTEETRDKINANIGDNEYFDVVRKEISANILKMRFGKVLWSKHDGFIKRKIVLVQEKYDDDKQKLLHGFNEPEISNMQKLLAQQSRYSGLLESLLVSKGIITSDETAKIKEEVNKSYPEGIRDYYLVDDVEKYN